MQFSTQYLLNTTCWASAAPNLVVGMPIMSKNISLSFFLSPLCSLVFHFGFLRVLSSSWDAHGAYLLRDLLTNTNLNLKDLALFCDHVCTSGSLTTIINVIVLKFSQTRKHSSSQVSDVNQGVIKSMSLSPTKKWIPRVCSYLVVFSWVDHLPYKTVHQSQVHLCTSMVKWDDGIGWSAWHVPNLQNE